ncbi:MAG TPA: hypothetical protein VLA74_00160 [Nitrososphaeraceae archaeon]|nr:hypothetical protein [Nitrososphaeraceae archaeon]
MGKKKKEIKIIKNNSENYTFINDNILDNINNINAEVDVIDGNDNSNKKHDTRIDKKIDSKQMNNKGRKIIGKSMQGHSPIYE